MFCFAGFLNPFGAYCQWRATDINLSKLSVLSIWDDVLAISLGFLFLGELQFVKSGIAGGIAICAVAFILFARHDIRKERAEGRKKRIRHPKDAWLYVYVLGYTTVFGLIAFFQRKFALEEVSIGSFVFAFYAGSLVSAFFISAFAARSWVPPLAIIAWRNIILMGISALFVIGNIVLIYTSFILAPIVIVKPIYFVAQMVFPALVGLYIFKERERLSRTEKAAFVIALAGGLLIATSFK